MPANESIFLALVAGFLFLSLFTLSRYSSKAWDGPRLILWSGLVGYVLLIVANLLAAPHHGSVHYLSKRAADVFAAADAVSVEQAEQRKVYVILAGISVILPLLLNAGVRLLSMLNAFGAPSWQLKASTTGGNLRALLYEAANSLNAKPYTLIEVSLAGGKVYVGAVTDYPSLSPSAEHFRLLPVYSGYRNKETKDLVLTTDYTDLADSLVVSPVVLPLADVASARVFTPDVYFGSFGNPHPSLRGRGTAESIEKPEESDATEVAQVTTEPSASSE